jgi:bifunctional UDP-N-acetylglucosamine pyrophosphorylase/glucosamine-1-phosphate N-acetyltransferase
MKTNIKYKKTVSNSLKQDKLREKAMLSGVNLLAPETIFLSTDTSFGKNVTIEPYVVIGPKVSIGNNVSIKSFSYIEGTIIEKNVSIGPYARLRKGTILKKGSKVGNFVETKKSLIGKNVNVNHLSYIGDATVGENSNIGAGTITCNYDGVNKSKTKIGKNVFIGSNSSLVAPIKIEDNATVGASSVITKKVKKASLALTRSPQQEVQNYKRKKNK